MFSTLTITSCRHLKWSTHIAQRVVAFGLRHRLVESHQAHQTRSATTSVNPPVFLRDYQQDCIDHSLELMNQGIARQAVSLPVGSGKTVTFSHLIPQVPCPTPRATRTLVLAHRTELLVQAMNKIKEANPKLSVAIEQGSAVAPSDTDVVVASVPTLGRGGSKRIQQFDPSEFKCIIIDEAHHAPASTYLRILDYFGVRKPDNHIQLWGCSATLRRHDGISLGAVFTQLGFERTILDMWEEKWLCRAHAIRITTGVDLSKVRVTATKDYSSPQLAAAINTSRRNEKIVEMWRVHADSKGRRSTLVFCVDVEHIKNLQAAFVAAGVSAYAVDGKTSHEERAQILEAFRAQEIPVLLNCAVFTEGTDIPCIDCVILARPTKSSVLFQQMVGRGLRLHKNKENCLILDINDNFGSNVGMTVPSLLGLVPEFDVQGSDVYECYKKMKTLVEEYPEAMMAESLDDATMRVKQFQLGLLQTNEIKVEHESVPLLLEPPKKQYGLDFFPFLDESAAMIEVGIPPNLKPTEEYWPKTDLNMILKIPHVGSVRVYKQPHENNHLYRAQMIPCDVERMDDIFPIPLVADTFEQASSGVQSYLQREFPTEFRKLMFGDPRNLKGANNPPTHKQMFLLKRLIGPKRLKDLKVKGKPMTKGRATMMIDMILQGKKNQTKKMKKAKDRAEYAEKIRLGIVPMLG